MPNFVKNPEQEKRWFAAKAAAGKSTKVDSDDYWRLSNYIYHKLGKSEEDQRMAEELKKSLIKTTTSVPSTSVPNPSKVGSTAVKMPKSKKMADPFGKPSLFFKSEVIKQPSIQKLRDFLVHVRGRKQSS